MHLSWGSSAVVEWPDSLAESPDSCNLGDIVGFYDCAAGHGVPIAGSRRLLLVSRSRRLILLK